MGRATKDSLFVRLSIILSLVIISIVALQELYIYNGKKADIMSQIEQETNQSLKVLQDTIAHFVESYSVSEYQQILKNKITNSDMYAIVLEDYTMGELLNRKSFTSGFVRDSTWGVIEYDEGALPLCFYQGETIVHSKLNKPIAKLSVCFSDNKIKEELDSMIVMTLKHIFIISAVLIVSLFYALSHLLITPISNTIATLEECDSEGIPLKLLPRYPIYELDKLSYAINEMIQTIKESHIKLRAIIHNIPDLLWIKDPQGVYLACNRRFEEFFGAKESMIIGKNDYDFIDKKLADFFRKHDQAAMQADKPLSNFEEIAFASDGHKEYLHVTKTKIVDANDAVYGVLGIARDFTQMRKKELLIKKYLEIIDEHIITSTTDLKGTITSVSKEFCRISGFAQEELVGNTHEILRSDTTKAIYDTIWHAIVKNNEWKGEIKNQRKDGSCYWLDTRISPLFDVEEQKTGYIAISHDITDKKRIEEISITDGLTQIYNRRYFNEMLPKIINRTKRNNQVICFLICDVDFFKQYNDTYGHQKGDDVLIALAASFKNSLKRADDFCFRLGGEEFGIIFESQNRQHALHFANSIRQNVENLKIRHKNSPVSPYVTISVGLLCQNALKIKDEKQLYSQADSLLYQAKESGRNRVCTA